MSRDNVCLVTGATGFIGGRLTERLRARRLPGALPGAPDERHRDRWSSWTWSWPPATSRRRDTLARAADGCRYVFHCGAMVSDWATPKEVSAVNVVGTRNLLSACAGSSVQRLVHFSTTDVYGYPGGAEIDESYSGTGFSNWYAQTKLAAEIAVRRAGMSMTSTP